MGLNIAAPAAFPSEPRASALCRRTGMAVLRLAPMLLRIKTSPRQEIQLLPYEDLSAQLTSLGTRRVTQFTGFMTSSASHVFSTLSY